MRLAFGFPLTTLVSLARYPRHQIGHLQRSSLSSFLMTGRYVWVCDVEVTDREFSFFVALNLA